MYNKFNFNLVRYNIFKDKIKVNVVLYIYIYNMWSNSVGVQYWNALEIFDKRTVDQRREPWSKEWDHEEDHAQDGWTVYYDGTHEVSRCRLERVIIWQRKVEN